MLNFTKNYFRGVPIVLPIEASWHVFLGAGEQPHWERNAWAWLKAPYGPASPQERLSGTSCRKRWRATPRPLVGISFPKGACRHPPLVQDLTPPPSSYHPTTDTPPHPVHRPVAFPSPSLLLRAWC